MVKILHFADAHIDVAAHGRRDPETGLPLRVLDFLKSLDTIIETAISERVDMVLFAGDAYKDRTPVPTFQREWGRRIMRLSSAGIPTFLLVGNHDLSPAVGRANTMQEFDTLSVPHVNVLSRPVSLGPADLENLPLQLLALPWISRSAMLAALEENGGDPEDVYTEIEQRITELMQSWLEKLDPALPTVLTAHASVQGATYGGERSVMLGSDLVLPASLVKDSRLDYVALGHIHKCQDLNQDAHPPVIYPGSIERVDFGEARDDKFFVIAQVDKGHTEVEWRKLDGRHFIDRYCKIQSEEFFQQQVINALPDEDDMEGAIVRLIVEYPRQWDSLLDETDLRRRAGSAFDFHLVRRPQMEARLRIPGDRAISSLSPHDLLEIYWKTAGTPSEDLTALQAMAKELLGNDGVENQ